jgi:peptidoglycan/LPS O-acetylase OafA/YrhL
MNWKPLDKIDSSLYKGIAILMIVIHNFMHLFPAPKENEFNFKPYRFFDLLSLLLNEPENVIRVSFSFFGHFGVQIFIFLSAYGLTKRYYLRKITYWPFIWGRIIKIYPSFILAILAWAIITGWVYPGFGLSGPLKVLHLNIESLIFKLTPLPGNYLSPVGPWWFIPFIFQFYFTFPFLLNLYSKWGELILLIISATSILVSIAVQGIIIIPSIGIGGIKVYFTILGHLPEFCLGIYLASRDDTVIRIPTLILLVAFTIYFLGNIYEIFWYANHISFLILLLAAFSYVIPKIKGIDTIKKIFLFFGSISMPLFLVNGFLRRPFISWAKEHNDWLLTIVLCMLSLTISLLVALTLSKIERHLMSRLIQQPSSH